MIYDFVAISPNPPPGYSGGSGRYVRKYSMTLHEMELDSKPCSYMYWGYESMQQTQIDTMEKKIVNLENRVKELEKINKTLEERK